MSVKFDSLKAIMCTLSHYHSRAICPLFAYPLVRKPRNIKGPSTHLPQPCLFLPIVYWLPSHKAPGKTTGSCCQPGCGQRKWSWSIPGRGSGHHMPSHQHCVPAVVSSSSTSQGLNVRTAKPTPPSHQSLYKDPGPRNLITFSSVYWGLFQIELLGLFYKSSSCSKMGEALQVKGEHAAIYKCDVRSIVIP